MSDNLKGIPFSTDDEGISYPLQARSAVVTATEQEDEPVLLAETYVVSFTYVLGNWKALVSTSRPDGRYFEVTHSKEKVVTFVDTYIKIKNVEIHAATKEN